jgi:hypothetical protein
MEYFLEMFFSIIIKSFSHSIISYFLGFAMKRIAKEKRKNE